MGDHHLGLKACDRLLNLWAQNRVAGPVKRWFTRRLEHKARYTAHNRLDLASPMVAAGAGEAQVVPGNGVGDGGHILETFVADERLVARLAIERQTFRHE